MIEYVTPSWGKPGDRYFVCRPMSATLTTDACSLNWRTSHQPGVERLHRCKTCPIGAIHSGETEASLSPLRGAKICSRCSVGTMRLIGGWLCVSCYNREREYRLGANAKGKVPTKMVSLTRRAVRLYDGGCSRTLTRDLTADVAELLIGALRDSEQIVRFAFNGVPSAQYAQRALF